MHFVYRDRISMLHHVFLLLNFNYCAMLVMGGIENFLSRLLKDKILRYHGILPCRDFYILNQYFTEKFTLYDIIEQT